MKYLVSLVAIAALSACSSEPAEPEATPEAAPVVEEPVAMSEAVSEAPAPGDYLVTYEDGTEQPFTMNADGTWTGTQADGSEGNGTWTQQNGKTCFVTDPPAEDDSCWTNQPLQADGSWTSTNDNGVTVTVRPAAPAEG